MVYEWKFCVFDDMAKGGYCTAGTIYGAIVSFIGTICRFNATKLFSFRVVESTIKE